MKKVFAVVFSLACLFANCDTLYWQITDSATVDGGSIFSFVESYGMYEEEYQGETYTGYNVAARVKVTGGNLSGPVYLPIYIGEGVEIDGEFRVDFSSDLGGYWGVGAPTGIQSPLEGFGSEIFMEYAFMVELGELTWDDVAEDFNWTTIAQSDEFAAEMLSQYIHERYDLDPPSLEVWSPTEFHTVPEPNSLMLSLVGVSLFLLMRPRGKI